MPFYKDQKGYYENILEWHNKGVPNSQTTDRYLSLAF